MDKLHEVLEKVLGAVYPQVVFDADGLTNMLLPCLVICLLGLVITIILKVSANTRRFSHIPVLIALIAMIAASSFFPVSLTKAGGFVVDQFREKRQMFMNETDLQEQTPGGNQDALNSEAPK